MAVRKTKMSLEETLVIEYTRPKEHIETVKKAAADLSFSLEEFVFYRIKRYLDTYWFGKRIAIPQSLFRKLSRRARELNLTTNDYANQLLIRKMEFKEAEAK